MERDGTGQLSTIYTYGNQRINSESYNNLSGLYTYDGRGSVSAVIGSWGDFRASYWYDGLKNRDGLKYILHKKDIKPT